MPADTPVTVVLEPESVTVATEVLLDNHVPPAVVLDNVVVVPEQKLKVPVIGLGAEQDAIYDKDISSKAPGGIVPNRSSFFQVKINLLVVPARAVVKSNE